MTRRELIHEAHFFSCSEYTDKKIKLSLPFPTSLGLGINVNLWFNEHGTVIGLDYYREQSPEESATKEKK